MEFRVPELGEGVYEAELVEWLVRTGDSVCRGDALAEVMTDKATMELPAPFSGSIDALIAQAGETIEIGQLLLRYSPHAGDAGHAGAAASSQSASSPAEKMEQPTRTALPRGGRAHGNGAPRKSILAAPAVRKMARS